jgi:hypothetical protein
MQKDSVFPLPGNDIPGHRESLRLSLRYSV